MPRLLDTVLRGDPERLALLAEADTAEPHRLAEIHERLRAIGADAAPARAAAILAGLGFDEAAQAAPGGGVLRRLAHARGAGHRAVRRPRPAAARRADQPPRPGSHAVAGDLARPLPRRGAAGLARPRPAGPRGAGDRVPRPRHASPLPPAASTSSSASAPSAPCSRPARPNASPPNARTSSRSSTASATRRARRARRSRASRRWPACRRSRR